MDPSLLWVLILLFVLLSGFFSACETALATCNEFAFRVRANDGNTSAKLACFLLDKYDLSQISIVVDNNIVNTILSTLGSILFSFYIINNDALVNLVSTIVITLLIFIFGDTIPKIIARAIPDRFISITSIILIFLYYLLWPIIKCLYYISLGVKKLFKVKDPFTLTEEDFSNYINEIEDVGKIDESESDIIQNALDFADTSVKEIFTPLDKIYALDINKINNSNINSILLDTTYSRIPIYRDNKQNIIGTLNVKKYFDAYMKDKHVSIISVLTKPLFVNSNDKIDDIFDGFRRTHTHIAFIKNNENIIGMITMEDILEELVGEIAESNSLKEKI